MVFSSEGKNLVEEMKLVRLGGVRVRIYRNRKGVMKRGERYEGLQRFDGVN
jgi:hypothetical protein